MFKNRSFRLKLVKDEAPITDYITPEVPTVVKVNIILEEVTKRAATLIAVYVAADTVRRVVIYAASAKL